MSEHVFDDAARALTQQRQKIHALQEHADGVRHAIDSTVAGAEALLTEAERNPLPYIATPRPMRSRLPLRSWEEIIADAQNVTDGDIAALLSPDEICEVEQRLAGWDAEFRKIYCLDKSDYVIAAIAGALGAILDLVLVRAPSGLLSHPGGPLSNVIRQRLRDLLPSATVSRLERIYKVPYDASTNVNLHEVVSGLSPRSHRVQTPGHDVLLSWIFGTRDVLCGQFTAIGTDGKLVVQGVPVFDRCALGSNLFTQVLHALKIVAGHLASDIGSRAGLPPPLFCLLEFLQFGKLHGPSGQELTIADAAAVMYRKGYDFGHFLAGGLCTLLIEAIVRTAWVVREFSDGAPISDIIPVGHARLDSTLFVAHSVATMLNAGTVSIANNIMWLNWAEWLTLGTYAAKQTLWLAGGKEHERQNFVRTKLDEGWSTIDADLATIWGPTNDESTQ